MKAKSNLKAEGNPQSWNDHDPTTDNPAAISADAMQLRTSFSLSSVVHMCLSVCLGNTETQIMRPLLPYNRRH